MINFLVHKPGGEGEGPARFRAELALLRQPGALLRQMALIDRARAGPPLRRLLVMGCGRSGTWLLTAVMTSFQGVDYLPAEVPLEYFGLVTTDLPVLLLKRSPELHERVEQVPAAIHVTYIVRHPFDVLTSHNPARAGSAYHITPGRWLSEMLALQYLVDTGRPNTTILRYEDLVADPAGMQARLAKALGLPVATAADKVMEQFAVGEGTARAMHGIRPIDRDSVGRFRSSPEAVSYLRHVRPRLGRLLDWVAETYAYDLSLEA